jgi:hypothetical protein
MESSMVDQTDPTDAQFRPSIEDMSPVFADPEAEAELLDPELEIGEELETTTARLRTLWDGWKCGNGVYIDQPFFGKTIGGIPAPAQDAFRALEMVLRATGYEPKSRWAYNCRNIGGSSLPSLHSYGIAVDLDPKQNPFAHGDRYSGLIKAHHVSAVLAIKNTSGRSIWSWGGNWSKPDRMHFQLDQGPDAVDVDWSTVPGVGEGDIAGDSGSPASRPRDAIDEEENMLTQGSAGEAVKIFQEHLRAWNADALPKFGPDGDFGSETRTWVENFQREFGLEPTGNIDGVTAVLIARNTNV